MTKDESESEPPQPPNKSNIDYNNLVPYDDLYLQSGKIIDHKPDLAEGKKRYSPHRWV